MEPIKKYKAVEYEDQHSRKNWTIEPYVPYKYSWKDQITNLTFKDFAKLLNIAYTQGHIDTINGELNQN